MANTVVYGAILSPFVRKVLVTLELKGIDYEGKHIMPFAVPDGYEKIHPLKKVPALQDDQLTIADSSVICDYLERRYPEPALYPTDPVERAKALWYEEYGDSELLTVFGAKLFFPRVVKKQMMGKPIDEAVVEQHIAEGIPPVLEYLTAELGDKDYLVGNQFSIADLSIVNHFINASYADWTPDSGRWPKLAAYVERIRAMPVVAARLAKEANVLAS